MTSLCILLSFKERERRKMSFSFKLKQNFSIKSFDKILSDSMFSFRIKRLSLYYWSVYICVCAQCACLVPTGSNVHIWPRELKVPMEFISLSSIYLSWPVNSLEYLKIRILSCKSMKFHFHANQWNFIFLGFYFGTKPRIFGLSMVQVSIYGVLWIRSAYERNLQTLLYFSLTRLLTFVEFDCLLTAF